MKTPSSRLSARGRLALPAGRRLVLPAAAVAATLLLTGCAGTAAESSGTAAQSPGAPTAAATAAPASDLYGHVHGISADPQSGRVLLATHNGLFAAGPGSADGPLGPVIDLMGFSAGGDGQYFASGHPGPGTDLPEPVGLIRSTDDGRTWEQLSRQGESDFHALTVTRSGVLGFDGELRLTEDLKTWRTLDAGFHPYSLAGTATSPVVLATTEQGVRRSSDGGKTWSSTEGGPVLLLTAFADDATAAGITPDGLVYASSDAGRSWRAAGSASAPPEAMTAEIGAGGKLLVWVYTANGLEYSDDGGKTFTPHGT
jgi:hypothetical protein